MQARVVPTTSRRRWMPPEAIRQMVVLGPKAKREIERDLSRYRRTTGAALSCSAALEVSTMMSNILNSKGVHVAVVTGHEVFSLKGEKLYDLRGANIYKLNGDLVGHLSDARGTEKRLDKATDRLFPAS